MKLIIIFGGGAVGKMTVGQELVKITDFKLFHNHISIEPVIEVFGTYYKPAVNRIREVFFEEFLKTENYGLIFTFIWGFSSMQDTEYIQSLVNQYGENNTYLIELVTDIKTKLERNRTGNRRSYKKSKKDFEFSEKQILDEKNHRIESLDGEIKFKNYIKIDNTNLSAKKVAKIIKENFNLIKSN